MWCDSEVVLCWSQVFESVLGPWPAGDSVGVQPTRALQELCTRKHWELQVKTTEGDDESEGHGCLRSHGGETQFSRTVCVRELGCADITFDLLTSLVTSQ